MSNYVVIARFADQKDSQLKELYAHLSESGFSISEWPPHITIAAYENVDEDALSAWTAEFCSSHQKIRVSMNALSIMPPGGEHGETAVLCLEPAHSKTLVDFYYAFHEKYEEYCTGIGFYNSIIHDSPIIHVTLGVIKVKEIQTALELVLAQHIFGEATITALEIYTYPMRLIRRFELH